MPSLISMAKDARNKKTAAPKKALEKTSQPFSLSAEFVQESDLEEDESSDEVSSSDEEDLLPDNPVQAAPKEHSKVAVVAADVDSSSGSENESASDSESEQIQGDERNETGKEIFRVSGSAKPASSAKTVSFEKPAPFKPPKGFELALIDEASSTSQLFQNSNLEGRQIWYITAPGSVPIASIQEASLAKIQKGEVVMLHNDKNYALVQDSSEDAAYTKVMVPNSAENDYRPVARTIDRILKLKEIVQLPSVYNLNVRVPGSTIPRKKPVRPQPHGLKMRFRPLGFGDGELGNIGSSPPAAFGTRTESGSDEEMEDGPQEFQRPASLDRKDSPSPPESDEPSSSSSSEAEMMDLPNLKTKSAVDSKFRKSVAEDSPKVAGNSLKRKHSEGLNTKAKNSSFKSEVSNNRQLNTVKENQASSTGSKSVSTEAQKTAPSKQDHPTKFSSSHIPPPKSKKSRPFPGSSSQNLASLATPIKLPGSFQTSPSRDSTTSKNHLASKKESQVPSLDHQKDDQACAGDPELVPKKQNKEIKTSKKDASKLVPISDLGEPATSSSAQEETQVQNLLEETSNPQEKHRFQDSKAGKQERKKQKMVKIKNEQAQEPRVHSTSEIPPPRRKHSMIAPPKGRIER